MFQASSRVQKGLQTSARERASKQASEHACVHASSAMCWRPKGTAAWHSRSQRLDKHSWSARLCSPSSASHALRLAHSAAAGPRGRAPPSPLAAPRPAPAAATAGRAERARTSDERVWPARGMQVGSRACLPGRQGGCPHCLHPAAAAAERDLIHSHESTVQQSMAQRQVKSGAQPGGPSSAAAAAASARGRRAGCGRRLCPAVGSLPPTAGNK